MQLVSTGLSLPIDVCFCNVDAIHTWAEFTYPVGFEENELWYNLCREMVEAVREPVDVDRCINYLQRPLIQYVRLANRRLHYTPAHALRLAGDMKGAIAVQGDEHARLWQRLDPGSLKAEKQQLRFRKDHAEAVARCPGR